MTDLLQKALTPPPSEFTWPDDDYWNGPIKRGWKQTAKGACCDWDTFWAGFIEHWRAKYPVLRRPPDEIVKQAHRHWARYAMTGYEAFVTVNQKVAEDAPQEFKKRPSRKPPGSVFEKV